ncbi:MAG: hypothetical protein IKV22_00890 [Paludibacteraceae bacterium]|nr:hypothetical protein [Paludibacteraceae bacterium]
MKTQFYIVLLSLLFGVAPIYAQTRKDIKEAETERWKQQQRQEAEISELRHDIRKANLLSEQAAMNAQIDAQKKAEERAKEKAREEAAKEVVDNMPCGEYFSTKEVLRAMAFGEDYDQQFAIDIARSEAQYALASQISSYVQALHSHYNKSSRISGSGRPTSRESSSRIEQMINTSVDQAIGYRIICRKSTSYILDGEKLYKGYVAIEIDADEILQPLYDGMQADQELELDLDYERFKAELEKMLSQN